MGESYPYSPDRKCLSTSPSLALDSSCGLVCLMVGLSLSNQTKGSFLLRVSLLIYRFVGCFAFLSRQPADHAFTLESSRFFCYSFFLSRLVLDPFLFLARYGPPATSDLVDHDIGLKFPNLLSWLYDGNVISVEFSHWDLGEELSFLYNMQ